LPLETSYPDVALELEHLGLAAPSAVQVAEAVTRIRLRKLPQPAEVGNAGSFFKNPTVDGRQLETLRKHLKLDAFAEGAQQHKISAARLIDAAGWKGHRTGDAAVWRRQPLVIVNLGGASGHEILALATRIKEDVAQRYDVELEFEPTVLGQEA
jgi:UDP-N-acetylmuramate dehydrogenase